MSAIRIILERRSGRVEAAIARDDRLVDFRTAPFGDEPAEDVTGRLFLARVTALDRHVDGAFLDIGGDRQRVHDIQTTVRDVTFKHILLPVWMAAYKYRGKTYRFVVNGRTGKVQGERPYSAWKIAFAVILGLIVAGVIGYFAAQQQ